MRNYTLLISALLLLLATPTHIAAATPITHQVSRGEPKPPLLEARNGDQSEPAGIKSTAIKKALRTLAQMLRSSKLDDVLSWLESRAGIGVAKVIKKHARTIANTLDRLCKWEELTLKMVEEQIVGALFDVGVPRSKGRTVAFWIKQFISWTLL